MTKYPVLAGLFFILFCTLIAAMSLYISKQQPDIATLANNFVNLLVGGLLFISFCHFMFFNAVKRTSFLISGTYLFSLFIILLIKHAMGHDTGLWLVITELLVSISLGLLFFYANTLFQLKQSFSRLYHLHRGLSVVPLILTVVMIYLRDDNAISYLSLILAIEFIYLIILSIYLNGHQVHYTKTFCLLMLLLLIAYNDGLLTGYFALNGFTEHQFLVASVCLALFSLISTQILAHKFATSVQEKHTIQQKLLATTESERTAQEKLVAIKEEAQEQLEYSVQERTLELKIALQELEEANKELKKRTTHDNLSGLYNRQHFDNKILAEFRRSRRELTPLSLVVIDIDHFKRINDTCGHISGDKCIKQVSTILIDNLKRSADLAFRYGGEEFCLILPNTAPKGAISIAESIRMVIEQTVFDLGEHSLEITASFGVTTYRQEPNLTQEALFSQADKALYQAKNAGRNQVQYKPILESTDPQENSE